MKREWSVSLLIAVSAVVLAAAGNLCAAPGKDSEKIDRLVFGKLKELEIPPSAPCADETFASSDRAP